VCVGASGSTTASDDPSSSVLCVMCTGRFPRGVPGGGRYAPPGYTTVFGTGHQPRADGVRGSGVNFSIFSGFCYF
jgi:hypothetical protein